MNIQTLSAPNLPAPQSRTAALAKKEDPTLRYACREMEGFFVSILLKQGLSSLTEDSEEQRSTPFGPMLEHTIEQVSRDISAQQGMGLADMLYDQLSQ